MAYHISGAPGNGHIPNSDNFSLLIKDQKKGKIYEAFPLSRNEKIGIFNFTYGNRGPLWSGKDKVYFSPTYAWDIIYSIHGNRIRAAYSIDFMGKGIPRKAFKNMTQNDYLKFRQRYYNFDGNFMDFSKYIYFNVWCPGNSFKHAFYDKGSGKCYFTNKVNFEDPMLNFFEGFKSQYNDTTGVIVSPSAQMLSFLDQLKKIKEKVTPNKYVAQLFDLKANDNPVLIFYTLK